MTSYINNKYLATLIKSITINRNKIFDRIDYDDYIILKGSDIETRQYSDVEINFRQNSNFFWLTGIDQPGYNVLINCNKRDIILVVPNLDINYTIWCGKIPNYNIIKNLFKFNDIITLKDLESYHYVTNDIITKYIEEFRIIKNIHEIKLMKEANRISSLVHNKIIYNKVQFNKKKEKNIANYFLYYTHEFDGVNNLAYPSIVGSNINASILHYTACDKTINTNGVILIDAGCEFMNYASDITTTFSMSKFNKFQQAIYDIVIYTNNKCKNMVKEHADFKNIYYESLRCIYDGIKLLNILNIKYIEENNIDYKTVAKCLMPHGLGHFIGLDVHDVGGSLYNYRNDKDSIILKENMVITIEPGIYFIKPLLLKNKNFFNKKIQDYMHVGGVRIEDVIVVLKEGYQQLNDVIR